jgi:hypothetical protein
MKKIYFNELTKKGRRFNPIPNYFYDEKEKKVLKIGDSTNN